MNSKTSLKIAAAVAIIVANPVFQDDFLNDESEQSVDINQELAAGWSWGIAKANADVCWTNGSSSYCYNPDETDNDGAECLESVLDDYDNCIDTANGNQAAIAMCSIAREDDLDKCP